MNPLRISVTSQINFLLVGLQLLMATLTLWIVWTTSEGALGSLAERGDLHEVATLAKLVSTELNLLDERWSQISTSDVVAIGAWAKKETAIRRVLLFELRNDRIARLSWASRQDQPIPSLFGIEKKPPTSPWIWESGSLWYSSLRVSGHLLLIEVDIAGQWRTLPVRSGRSASLVSRNSSTATELQSGARFELSTRPSDSKDAPTLGPEGASSRVEGTDLVLLVRGEPDVASQSLQLVSRIGLTLAVGFLFAVWFALLLSHRLKRRLLDLYGSAEAVSRGDYSKRIASLQSAPMVQDELDETLKVFDRMTKELQAKLRLESAVEKLHGREIASQVASGEIKLGGERRTCIIFFCDLRGFSTFSERMSPESVVMLLNQAHSVVIRCIESRGGLVTNIIGDGVMAAWGFDQLKESDVDQALEACLEIRLNLAALNRRLIADGRFPLYMGMGLHLGPAVVGTVGSARRMQFTAIGDTTNTASRIESATKEFGTDLLVSEDLLKHAKRKYIVELIETRLKGKRQALALFKVLGRIRSDGRQEVLRTTYSQFEPEKMARHEYQDFFTDAAEPNDEVTAITQLHTTVEEADLGHDSVVKEPDDFVFEHTPVPHSKGGTGRRSAS